MADRNGLFESSTAVLPRFEYVITADDPFHEPWPPDGACSIVRRARTGFTLWRRLSLALTEVSS
jgi:hypothetical protein